MIIFLKLVQVKEKVKEKGKKNSQVVERNSGYHDNYNYSNPTGLDLSSLVNSEDTLFIKVYDSHLPKNKKADSLAKSRGLLLLAINYVNVSTENIIKAN